MNDKISIIVPIYNSQETLDRCINSIINQSYRNIEIILINDGSQDNSKNKCKDFQKQDDRIILINKENTGVSDCRNIGIKESTGTYIVFVDSDDYIEQDYIYNIYEEIKKSNCKVAFCGMIESNINKNKYKNVNYLDTKKVLDFNDYIDDFINTTHFSMVWKGIYKKETVESIKFDVKLKYGEDLLFLFNVLSNNRVLYFPYCGYHYVNNENSTLNDINVIKANQYIENNIYVFNEIRKKYPEKKVIIEKRLLTKLNITLSRLAKSKISIFEFSKNAKMLREKICYKHIIINQIKNESKVNKVKLKTIKNGHFYTYYMLNKLIKIIK
ncbi:MAG: glycosyltransferase family 2 protein [Clostridia bacterium]|nr:glycosyltransferase family 2 protein [Clostridia bacterium]